MQIKFTKMEGLGNDFVVLDVRKQARNLSLDNIKAYSVSENRGGL